MRLTERQTLFKHHRCSHCCPFAVFQVPTQDLTGNRLSHFTRGYSVSSLTLPQPCLSSVMLVESTCSFCWKPINWDL